MSESTPLPHSEDAEKSILSSMMQDPIKIDEAIEKEITKECFYVPANGAIFETLVNIHNSGKPIELLTINQEIKDAGILENIGGPSRIAEIYSFAVTDGFFDHHVGIVIEKYRLRLVIARCTEAISEAYNDPKEVDSFIDGFEKKVFSIGRSYASKKISSSDVLFKNTIRNFEKFIKGETLIEGLPTRFNEYNDLTKGFKKQEITIIAARPSVGKTSLMCNIIEDLTVQGISGMAFSLEMSDQQLADRILYGRARFPMHYLRKGFMPTRAELVGIQESFTKLLGSKFFIDDTPAITIDELRSKLRRKKKEFDIEYFCVDYLQLMRSGLKKYEGREREVAEISSGLKAIAKELNIPGIVLAQLNRGPERRQGKAPTMSDLRESGAIEQDADVVALLHRIDTDDDEGEEVNKTIQLVKLIIDKNRNGPTGEIDLKFNKEIMEFKS